MDVFLAAVYGFAVKNRKAHIFTINEAERHLVSGKQNADSK